MLLRDEEHGREAIEDSSAMMELGALDGYRNGKTH
jgi:hypothetical protein